MELLIELFWEVRESKHLALDYQLYVLVMNGMELWVDNGISPYINKLHGSFKDTVSENR